jgi:hypothetical protein
VTDGSTTVMSFSSAHPIVKWLLIFLIVEIIVLSIELVSNYMEINLLSSIIDGKEVTINEAEANDNQQLIVGIFSGIISITTLVIFFYWFYRAYRNLPSFGARGLKFSPKWVVVYFFLPILSLYKPFQAAKEIWNASDPDVDQSDGYSWQNMKAPNILAIWWIFWILSSIVGFRSLLKSFGANTFSEIVEADWYVIVANVLIIISNILFIFIVREIDSRQEKKRSQNNIIN